jgi:hypothetical protein
MTALYLERYLNFGLSLDELQSGKPIIGIAQTGSDLSPCNRHHLVLAERVREGIRTAGGIVLEFPVHPIQETGKRPTAGLDRNLSYLGLVETAVRLSDRRRGADHRLRQDHPGLPDGGRDREHPRHRAVGRPDAERLAQGQRTGSGTIVWKAREMLAAGEIDRAGFIKLVASSAPSTGYCNTMGTATTMNSLTEALGMSLTGSAAIPRPIATGSRTPTRPACGSSTWSRGHQAVRHPDPRRVPERHRRQFGDRRLDQRPDPPERPGPPHRRRAERRRLADLWRGGAAAGQPAAGRRVSGRGLLPRRRRAGRGQPADRPGPDPRGRPDRVGQDDRRGLAARRSRTRR